MRNLEKGILLGELINPTLTSNQQLNNLRNWIREQDCYQNLLNNMKKVKKSSTFISRLLYQEFQSIDLDRFVSIEEGLIAYSKILYLSKISIPNFYTNPLLVINKEERSIKLKDLVVKFNEKYMTIEDFSKDKTYSFNEKYEFITNKVNNWEKEVFEKILKPIKELKSTNPRNLPIIKLFSFDRFASLLVILLSTCFLIYGIFGGNELYKSIFTNWKIHTFNELNYLYLIFVSTHLLFILIFSIEILVLIFKYARYNKYRKCLLNEKEVIKVIDSNKENLKDHIINSFDNLKLLNTKIFKFSTSIKLYEYFLYLYYINYKCKRIYQPKTSTLNSIFICLLVVFWAIFVIVSVL